MRALIITVLLAAPTFAEPPKNAITMSSYDFKRSRGVEGSVCVKPEIERATTSKMVCDTREVYASHLPKLKTVCRSK